MARNADRWRGCEQTQCLVPAVKTGALTLYDRRPGMAAGGGGFARTARSCGACRTDTAPLGRRRRKKKALRGDPPCRCNGWELGSLGPGEAAGDSVQAPWIRA